MTFLPENYEQPASGWNYLRFKKALQDLELCQTVLLDI